MWLWLWNLGKKLGCHQLPERSFYWHGYQFPVCARCTGVYIGELLALFGHFVIGSFWRLDVLFCLVMLLDCSISENSFFHKHKALGYRSPLRIWTDRFGIVAAGYCLPSDCIVGLTFSLECSPWHKRCLRIAPILFFENPFPFCRIL